MSNDFIHLAINNNNYALSFVNIHEVVYANQYKIHEVPLTKKEFIGLINIHGSVVAVLDLKQMLGFGKTKIKSENKLIIIKYEDENIALLVNDVFGVVNILQNDISQNFLELDDQLNKSISGFGLINDLKFLILDIDHLIKAVFI